MVRVAKYKRPNGCWYVRYFLAGQRADESARTTSETAAETYRIRRELEINAGIQPIRHADVGDLLAMYLECLPPKTSTSHQHEAARMLHGFLRVCGRKRKDGAFRLRTEQLSPRQIDQYITRRQQVRLHQGENKDSRGRRVVRRRPVTNVTLRKELRYLSGFFNWCCRQRPPYLRENPIPLSNAHSIRDDARPHFMITEEEFRALLRVAPSPRHYLFLLPGWWTGGRRAEILALHYYHFDFKAGTVSIAHAKNRMYDVLPLSPEILELVQRLYREADEAARVFPADPLPCHAFARLCRRAGLRHHRFHDVRISTSMKIKSGGFDAGMAGLWVGNQGSTNRTYFRSDRGCQANRVASATGQPSARAMAIRIAGQQTIEHVLVVGPDVQIVADRRRGPHHRDRLEDARPIRPGSPLAGTSELPDLFTPVVKRGHRNAFSGTERLDPQSARREPLEPIPP